MLQRAKNRIRRTFNVTFYISVYLVQLKPICTKCKSIKGPFFKTKDSSQTTQSCRLIPRQNGRGNVARLRRTHSAVTQGLCHRTYFFRSQKRARLKRCIRDLGPNTHTHTHTHIHTYIHTYTHTYTHTHTHHLTLGGKF